MRLIDGDELLKRVQQEKIQAQVHGKEFSTCFMNPGGTPSTEWWFVEDLIENAPTIESEPCEDAVSRKMVIDAVKASTPFCVVPDDHHISAVDMEFRISKLPSVTPRPESCEYYALCRCRRDESKRKGL